jgi:arylsulfatase A-like enzyme
MNLVLIFTDTQNKDMVGAYGDPSVATPHLDRLAAEGIRFERAYPTCPLCTPARGSIFSGLHPQINGAWANNLAPSANVPLMGEIFRQHGYRVGYSGKWHLDGSGYFGDGEPGGGFEPEWWYDGKRYLDDIGPRREAVYRRLATVDDLREGGFTAPEDIWGHRVADRAIQFLDSVGTQPFLLCVSFDEPHGPFAAPPEWWERFADHPFPERPNTLATLDGKPELQQIQRAEKDISREAYAHTLARWYGCNAYIDQEVGRVLEALDRRHRDDTLVLYTADHGDQRLSHGLTGKGPMMYEESCNVPFIARLPGGPAGAVSEALVSHLDLLPTFLAAAELEVPPALQGVSLLPALQDPSARVREHVLLSYQRFAINHDGWGGFYPIRCVRDRRYKLAVNLFDQDEFYDLERDPYELRNLIDEPSHAAERDRLHELLLDEMDAIRDPFRTWHWGNRPWREARKPFYRGGTRRNKPRGFAFEPQPREAAD